MTRDGPLWLVILAVGTGAGLGAVCRWMLSYFLNPLSGWMPWGTLASNAAGGLLILKTVESTLSQIRRRRARGTSGLWPSSP